MQRDITDYLEEIMNSGLSKEEKEVLMSELSKKLLQERQIENEQKKTTFEKSKMNFDIIDFCKRNNIEPIELGRIMMTPFVKGLSDEQKNILVNYLNDEKNADNIKNYVENNDYFCGEFSKNKQEVENYKNTIGSFSDDKINDDVLDMTRCHMVDVVINQQHVVHEIFPDEFLERFHEILKEELGHKSNIPEVKILNEFPDCFKACYRGDNLTTHTIGDAYWYTHRIDSEKFVNCFDDFGVKVCSENNSTEEEVHTVDNFLEFCKKNDIPLFEISKIMFAPSYECLDDDELNIVDKLLPITKQIIDVSQFNGNNLIEASNVVDFIDYDYFIFKPSFIENIIKYQSFNELHPTALYDDKRKCFDTMRMLLSKTFLENYDMMVPEGIRNSISKVSPMKTICDYGSFMDKMKAMYGYRRSLEKRTMTSSDREKLYNETIPNMNAVIDKFDDYEFGYSASSSSSIGTR